MFAKLARFHGVSHRHAAPLKTAFRNDNLPIHRLASVSRARRPALVCNWQRVAATGRLECSWQAMLVGAAAEEPGISWMIGPVSGRFAAPPLRSKRNNGLVWAATPPMPALALTSP
jgi:hypothetical protein